MRILYFHQHFAVPAGSGGTRSYEFARRLVAAGHAVTMVAGIHPGAGIELPATPGSALARGTVDGIDLLQIRVPYSNYQGFLARSVAFLRFAWHGIRLALREDYDLLFATSTPLTAGLPGIAMKLAARRKKPFVFEVRDLWPELPRAMGVIRSRTVLWLLALLERRTYAAADALVGLAPGICAGIRQVAPAGVPVAFIPNAADTDLFRPAAGAGRDLPGVAAGDFVAVFAGAHGIANGLDAVLDAAALLRHEPGIKFLFIGDGREKPRLLARARAEGLDNCLFHPPLPKTRLAAVLPTLDLGLMILADVPAFYRGTSPNKFFDYLASGIPVLVNHPGWLADEIAAHDCGVAVPPGDPAALAAAVVRLRDDREAARRLGANARRLAEERFARDRLAGEFQRFIEATLRHWEATHDARGRPRAGPRAGAGSPP
jgi:glycosyltransferase involved in cell wall biosynthesis